MSDTGSADETPLIPEELVPRQRSDDAVANDPDAAGVPDEDESENGVDHADQRRHRGEDDDKIDLNDLA